VATPASANAGPAVRFSPDLRRRSPRPREPSGWNLPGMPVRPPGTPAERAGPPTLRRRRRRRPRGRARRTRFLHEPGPPANPSSLATVGGVRGLVALICALALGCGATARSSSTRCAGGISASRRPAPAAAPTCVAAAAAAPAGKRGVPASPSSSTTSPSRATTGSTSVSATSSTGRSRPASRIAEAASSVSPAGASRRDVP
jgi:hypothetical protein